MSKPTTLQKCADYFNGTEWPGRLRHNVSGPRCFYYLLIPDGDEPDWAFTLTDDEATALIKEELWRRIMKKDTVFNRGQVLSTDGTGQPTGLMEIHLLSGFIIEGPDELELLLQAAEEVGE